MNSALPKIVTLIGAGVIGRGWIRVFAPHGVQVRVYAPNPTQIPQSLTWLEQDLAADVAEGFVTNAQRDTILKNTHGEPDLARALANTDYVQENAPEKIEVKRGLFAELDRLAPTKAILASSTSALDIGEIAKRLPGEYRCVMAHPFNPPHLMPVVEMLGAPGTDPAILQKACDLLAACGQIPVRINRYMKGFLGNRIQAAVIREALHLVETGVADAVAVDEVIRDGLALRWATIGNFGANHANADEGIVQYFSRYGESYAMLMEDLNSSSPRFDPQILRQIADAIEQREGVKGVAAFTRKRDVMVKV
jgi:L-gulonate 3-dehydrogenase